MTPGSNAVFVGSGEVSGDHYIANVVRELRAAGCGARIYGLCGEESRAEGVECLWPSERLQLIGFAEALTSIPRLLAMLGEITDTVVRENPAAMVVVDSPDFNLPLIRRLRKRGYRGRIFYISPPAVWAWRSFRVRQLADEVDECLPLFGFEHAYLREARCATLWRGHPFLDEVGGWHAEPATVVGGVSWGRFGEWEASRVVAILPGSRLGEIEQLYPILTGVSKNLEDHGYFPVFSVAPGLSERAAEYLRARIAVDGHSSYGGLGRDLMAASCLTVGASGTATVEALLLRRHMVVLYKVKALSAFIGRRVLKKVRYFAMPNVLARSVVYPELIQDRVTVEAATAHALEWLTADGDAKGRAARRLEEIVGLMGRPGAYGFWAERMLEALP